MVKRLLRSIRQKPKVFRDQIALGVAVLVTGSIFTVWLVTAPTRFASDSQQAQAPDSESERSGFANIFDGFNDVLDQSRNNTMTGAAIEADAPPEPTLAELVASLEAERAAENATTSERVPVGVWNSLPTTTSAREVQIIPVQNQATSATPDSLEE